MKIEMGTWGGVRAAGVYHDLVRIQHREGQYVLPFIGAMGALEVEGGFGNLFDPEFVECLPLTINQVRKVWITDPELMNSKSEFWTAELRLVRPDHTLFWHLFGKVAELEPKDLRIPV